LVNFGDENISLSLDRCLLDFLEEEQFYKVVSETEVDVISFIGVLEHIKEPQKMFVVFKQSRTDMMDLMRSSIKGD
jgi:hypothetical protein